MGDNFAQKTIGKGDIKVSMSMGGNEILDILFTNVLHVPKLAKKNFFVTKSITLGHFLNLEEKGVSP
jgi:hypothetical protein